MEQSFNPIFWYTARGLFRPELHIVTTHRIAMLHYTRFLSYTGPHIGYHSMNYRRSLLGSWLLGARIGFALAFLLDSELVEVGRLFAGDGLIVHLGIKQHPELMPTRATLIEHPRIVPEPRKDLFTRRRVGLSKPPGKPLDKVWIALARFLVPMCVEFIHCPVLDLRACGSPLGR